MVLRRPFVATCAACVALALGASAIATELDPAGRPAARVEAGTDIVAGCGTCRDPVRASYLGLTFRGTDMWMVANDGTLYRTRACQTFETISVQGFRGFATDVAWDSRRDRFVVTDAELELVHVVDREGRLLQSWPTPRTGAIGVTYDSARDVYWIADWETDAIQSIDPNSGAVIETFAVPAGSFIAGLAYDPGRDALYYNGRSEATCYAVSAASGHALLGSFPIGGSHLNGEGIGVAADGQVWIHLGDFTRVACYARVDAATPTRPTTWGELKRRYAR